MPQPLVPVAIIQLIDHRRERRPEYVALLDPKGLHVRVCATGSLAAEKADSVLRIGGHPVRVLLIDGMTEGDVALKIFRCVERVNLHCHTSRCHSLSWDTGGTKSLTPPRTASGPTEAFQILQS